MKKKKLTKEERQKKAEEEKRIIDKYWNDQSHNRTMHRIIIGDSRHMKSVKHNSIHLIVTSPPYFNAREYTQWPTLKEYLYDMKKTFIECFKVLQKGRKFCLNISDLPEKGESGVRWIPLGPELERVAQKVGFELVDRIIWYKTPVKGFQYGSLPFPPSPLICDSMEYIYVLRKPGKSSYSHLSKEQKEASRLRRKEYAEFTKQIWTMRRVRLSENMNGHIAPYPDELPHRCIKLYSFVGEVVLDPFGGSGTTTKMAVFNKRNSILFEIKEEYLKHIKEKLNFNHKRIFSDVEVRIEHEK